MTKPKDVDRDLGSRNCSSCRYRVVWHMASGRTSYGNWHSKVDAWHLIYTQSFLLDGEWIGIQQEGLQTEIVYRGPWWNSDKREKA